MNKPTFAGDSKKRLSVKVAIKNIRSERAIVPAER